MYVSGNPSNKQQGGRALPPPPKGPPSPPSCPRLEPVNREKTCPLLLIVFTKIGNHHSMEDFIVRRKEPKDEVQIYTYKDATLRELIDLVKEVAPGCKEKKCQTLLRLCIPQQKRPFQSSRGNSIFSLYLGFVAITFLFFSLA
ncbi:Histone deacetylase complex subunit SAP18 [Glycine max]|nr:Histone deacetylase complex subunit SAP18 [Glycine max]